MHELSLTRRIVAVVAERAGSRRVREVRLRVGAEAGISVEALRFCFAPCARGTPLCGAVLEIAHGRGDEFIIESMEVSDV